MLAGSRAEAGARETRSAVMVLSMVGMDYLYYPLQVAYGPGSYWYFRNNPFTTARRAWRPTLVCRQRLWPVWLRCVYAAACLPCMPAPCMDATEKISYTVYICPLTHIRTVRDEYVLMLSLSTYCHPPRSASVS